MQIHAFRGETAEATARLHDDLYIRELERQATIFNRSFSDAMDAALVTGDLDECWRHLQSALFASIVVNRLVAPSQVRGWPGMSPAEAKKIANDRALRLRRYVDLPDPAETNSPIYDVREVRDAMEHIDERWDRVTHGADPASVADWYLSAGLLLLAPTSGEQTQTPRGLRAFVPETGTLFFGATSLDMFQLDLDMLALRNNIEDARAASLGPPQGRFTFSDLEVIEHLDEASRKAALVSWDRERETRLGALLAPPGGDRTG